MKRTAITLACLVTLLAIAVIVLIVCDDPKARVNAVQKRLNQIPNVKVTYISDLTKQASEIISVDIEVAGKGRMRFMGRYRNSFVNSSRIRLSGIGPYGFRTRQLVGTQEAYGFDINIGPSSPIPAARNLHITSVRSAVEHYDDLLALVADWPVITGAWPNGWPPKQGEWSKTSAEEIHFPDLPGADYYFCLKQLSPTPTPE